MYDGRSPEGTAEITCVDDEELEVFSVKRLTRLPGELTSGVPDTGLGALMNLSTPNVEMLSYCHGPLRD